MRRLFTAALLVALVSSSAFWGCKSTPSKEELDQLTQAQSEVASLEKRIAQLESEKAALQKSIDEKDAKLKDCQANKAAVDSKAKGGN